MTFLTLEQARRWAAEKLKRDISLSNISYLVQYGKVKKYTENGTTLVAEEDLAKYYDSYHGVREMKWKERLGSDLNWGLSFDHLREKDTTKHVHRLHPYKGKFIPQLVEYFLDQHTDDFKKKRYFKRGDIVLDPFLGSGTTLVQANEMGMHGIGIDISHFNCLIAETKLAQYDTEKVRTALNRITEKLQRFETSHHIRQFEEELLAAMSVFNKKNFPNPDFKYDVDRGRIDEDSFATKKEKDFLPMYRKIVKKHGISLQTKKGKFIDRWYVDNVRREMELIHRAIQEESDVMTKKLLTVILSRTIRSCRATTHSDLATLIEPQLTTYYCYKHKKICKPLFSLVEMFHRYAEDTVGRIDTFASLRTDAFSAVLTGDSRSIDIFKGVKKQNPAFQKVIAGKKITGIFSSPPYVGQIDYHEQHAYAYDLFAFERQDELEIGPLFNGQGKAARDSYVTGISDVLLNCKKFLKDGADVFLVANDKFNLYPLIAERSGMKIVQQFKRPVLNRTERDRNPYSETIFHLRSV